MAQINQDFRHHLVNGLCGIRASEEILRSGYKWAKDEKGEYVKVSIDLVEELNNIDEQIKRVFKALRELEGE